MRPAAEVADVGLELIEGRGRLSSDRHDRDRFRGHRPQHDIGVADADVQGGQPLLGQAPIALELDATPVECDTEVAAANQLADLIEPMSSCRRARIRRSCGSWAGE